MAANTQPEMTLRQALLAQSELGLTEGDFSHHCSDLYVVAKPNVGDFIKKHFPYLKFTAFVSPRDSQWNGAAKFCYCVHFGYAEYFDHAHRTKQQQ